MDDQRLGAAIRAVRIRRGWRQADVAAAAGVSQSTVSRLERGHLAPLSVSALRAVGAVLDIRIDLRPMWRAGDLDRLLNARHSGLHESVALRLAGIPGWSIRPEVSFAIWGERGVVDVLAFHARRRMLLVVELKTDVVDVNELIGTLDRKWRLAREIARTVGWPADESTGASAWVIVAGGATNRRRIAAHGSVLRSAFPTDGRTMDGWLLDPRRPVRGLSTWSTSHGGTLGVDLAARRRVRNRSSCTDRRQIRAGRASERRQESVGD